MNISEMRERKRELGLTNERIAELSGVPLSTVQKLFAGFTRAPRRRTLEALEKVFREEFKKEISQEGSYGDSAPREPVPAAKRMDYQEFLRDRQRPLMVREAEPAYMADPRQGTYTLEDYYALPEDRRVELIDGYIYDMAAPTPIHQIILGELHYQLRSCADAHKDCRVFMAPADVRLDNDDYTMVQPDLFIICGRRDRDIRRLNGAPDFVVEILSPASHYHDMFRKLNKYKKAGVREYWIIDPDKKIVTVYDFEHDNLPVSYTFHDKVPLVISDGECSVDFVRVEEQLEWFQ